MDLIISAVLWVFIVPIVLTVVFTVLGLLAELIGGK